MLQARATNTILYDCIPVILYCIVKGYNPGLQQWCDWRGYKGSNRPPNKLNKKLTPYFICTSVCSILVGFQYVVVLRVFRKFLGCYFRVISSFSTVYRYPHPDTLLFINFFFNVDEGAPTMTSGPLWAIRFPSYG